MAESDTRPPSAAAAPAEAPRSLRSQRRAALAALAAEVGHDLQGPLNLFRLTHDRLARGGTLDDEDLSLLDEELARLARLSARLRGLAQRSLQRALASPRAIVDSALGSAPLPVGGNALELDVEAASSVAVACDLGLIAGAVRELIDNAFEARKRRAGVRFQAEPAAGLCVWDDGSGLALEPEQAMTWGVTTRTGAAGIGLTLALRAARAHGFALELRREAGSTQAWLWIPTHALRGPAPGEK